jgi:3-oxoacyl-[acyl-carrier protein] reductase
VNANTSRAEAEETRAMIGPGAAVHIADVTDSRAVAAMVEATVARFGRLDILVNNAAVRAETPFAEIRFEDWRRVLSIVLDGAFLCTQAALHLVRAGGGTVITSAVSRLTKGDGRAHVITAKAGLAGLTAACNRPRPHHITVNPWFLNHRNGAAFPRTRAPAAGALPLIGSRAAGGDRGHGAYLCGPDMRYVTGQSIHVNGGNLMP